jgi:hypothetical protein
MVLHKCLLQQSVGLGIRESNACYSKTIGAAGQIECLLQQDGLCTCSNRMLVTARRFADSSWALVTAAQPQFSECLLQQPGGTLQDAGGSKEQREERRWLSVDYTADNLRIAVTF